MMMRHRRHTHAARPEIHRASAPYRSRRGIFLGVCRGLAEYFDFSVAGVRLTFVVAAVFTGFWPVMAGYALAALLMRVAPVLPLNSDADAEFYNSYAASREMALLRVKRAYDQLERRIQRLESTVTTHGYDWERRLNTPDDSTK